MKLIERIKTSFHTIAMLAVISYALPFAAPSMAEESLKDRRGKSIQILDDIQKNIVVSTQEEAKLVGEISKLDKDRVKLNALLIAATANSRELEEKNLRAGARVLELEEGRDALRLSLKGRRALLAEVLAALQRMGRNPPPALLVTPKDALQSVRSAILLGSVVPEIRSETTLLAGELATLVKLSDEINAKRKQLSLDLTTQATDERRLALLIQKKQKSSKQANEKLAAQSVAASKLAARATNLTNLIAKLENDIEAVNLAAHAAKQAEIERERRQEQQIATARKEVSRPDFSDLSRISPAVKFSDAKGHLLRPVSGVEISKFGDRDELGDKSTGIQIATRIDARVISPADGWVVYSGKFRSYGQLLILNAGSNYHIVMSGMEKINVELGQFVLVGEPIGIMGSTRIASASTIDIELSRPVLKVELRKNSKPIDPARWWQENTDKRTNDDS